MLGPLVVGVIVVRVFIWIGILSGILTRFTEATGKIRRSVQLGPWRLPNFDESVQQLISEVGTTNGLVVGLVSGLAVRSSEILSTTSLSVEARIIIFAASFLLWRWMKRFGYFRRSTVDFWISWLDTAWHPHQRLELENDLIAAYLLTTGDVPPAQFLG